MDFTNVIIAQRLSDAFDPNLQPESPYPLEFNQQSKQPAAVLIPFLRQGNEWHLLFIRRTLHEHDRHSGQVAFPGGRCDSDETKAESAALREASEEIGINPQDVQILGKLRDMLTITNYRVTPVVGIIPWPYELVPQPEEVSRIFTIPLHWVADPTHREVRQRDIRIFGKLIPVIYFKPYDGETLWGASARMTMLLLEALGLSDPKSRYA
jgi:8-oxo-dGTP pyrophosphatase MutT (NUDIX family)